MSEAQQPVRGGWQSSYKGDKDQKKKKTKEEWAKYFRLKHINYVQVIEEPNTTPKAYFVERKNIRKTKRDEEFLIVGFDTEYVTPKDSFNNAAIRGEQARYKVLSYQFHAKAFDGSEWSGIILPNENERTTFSDFIIYVLGKGIASGVIASIPNQIYLVAHYNRADIPAFDDRDELIRRLSSIRKSLVTRDAPIKLLVNFIDGSPPSEIEDDVLNIYIRDTILLAPTGQKSLAELGNLVGCEKIILDEDKKEEKYLKENMDKLLEKNWDLFRRYALIDAEICVRYFDHIVKQYERFIGSSKIPSALSSIGVRLLMNQWKTNEPPIDPLTTIGKEEFSETVWVKEKQQFITKKKSVYKEELHWHVDFVTECYHGGRNEQFWFGPSYIADWSDYDLTGAYPTAMALIGMPQWDDLFISTNINDHSVDTLGFAYIDFEFDRSVRYPTLPIRTNNGIIFPRKGRCYCSSPEIVLARSLGCKIKIRHGVIIPQDHSQKIFFPFLKQTIENRLKAETKLENALWKELTNSCYGKTAQGLRRKRVFNIQKEANQQLPESPITNPFFAAYITSFVRAVVGEVINGIPDDRMVFSVTTDGFITDATQEEIDKAASGDLSKTFSQSRYDLTGKHEVLSEKHAIKRVLGWKTRGQATLIEGDPQKGDKTIVLAKAGIQPPPFLREVAEQNEYIVELFFNRTGDQKIIVDTSTSMRDMVLYHADLVKKAWDRKLNMEYDFKRRPTSVSDVSLEFNGNNYSHIVFNTSPWETIEEFKSMRQMVDDFIKNENHRCLKTKDDYRILAHYFDARNALPLGAQKYLSKAYDADLKRLKRDLCRAFKQGEAGLDHYYKMSANQFAQILLDSGLREHRIKCVRADIENAGRNSFEPHTTPRSFNVLKVIEAVKERLPELDIEVILSTEDNEVPLLSAIYNTDTFIRRLVG